MSAMPRKTLLIIICYDYECIYPHTKSGFDYLIVHCTFWSFWSIHQVHQHSKWTHKPLESDRRIIRHRLSYPIDHTLTPFSPQNTKYVINNIKNSPATGPDSISNFHLKHLDPQGIQALTNISNYTYAHCLIPNIWKQGIITILKPNEDPTTPSSYRPTTLLCTPSKITERLILNIIHPDAPLAPTQHRFQPLHSANILLTNLTQHLLDGINSKRPAQRTLLTTVDISKAFDAIPWHRLTDKLYNTNMHNNTKRWLPNYLRGRQSHM